MELFMSDDFDDAFFSKFCDESIVNQYLKMVAYSAQDFGSANVFSDLRSTIEEKNSLVSLLYSELDKERLKVLKGLNHARSQGVLIASLYSEIDKERSKVAELDSVLSRKQRKLIYNSKKSC